MSKSNMPQPYKIASRTAEPDRLAVRIAWLAYQASKAVPKAPTMDSFCVSESSFTTHYAERGSACDYGIPTYCGRSMYLSIHVSAEDVGCPGIKEVYLFEQPTNKAYQTWIDKYPTYQALMNAAVLSLRQDEGTDSPDDEYPAPGGGLQEHKSSYSPTTGRYLGNRLPGEQRILPQKAQDRMHRRGRQVEHYIGSLDFTEAEKRILEGKFPGDSKDLHDAMEMAFFDGGPRKEESFVVDSPGWKLPPETKQLDLRAIPLDQSDLVRMAIDVECEGAPVVTIEDQVQDETIYKIHTPPDPLAATVQEQHGYLELDGLRISLYRNTEGVLTVDMDSSEIKDSKDLQEDGECPKFHLCVNDADYRPHPSGDGFQQYRVTSAGVVYGWEDC